MFNEITYIEFRFFVLKSKQTTLQQEFVFSTVLKFSLTYIQLE